MSKPILFDLFCKAGGAGMGYHLEGFDVIGIDWLPQPNYPFRFIKYDALDFVREYGDQGDAWHGSPECKRFSGAMEMQARGKVKDLRDKHADLLTPLRPLLQATGKPYIIENVVGARSIMQCPIVLCGTMFGLKVQRHRLFESNCLLLQPPHEKHIGTEQNGDFVSPYGMGGARWIDPKDHARGKRKGSRKTADWAKAMEIDWMIRGELTQAIPPAYTRFLGRQLMLYITGDHLYASPDLQIPQWAIPPLSKG